MERICRECGANLLGRSDKKYCSEECKNSFNNRANWSDRAYRVKINAILSKNRRVLNTVLEEVGSVCPKEELLKRGFNFKYVTSIQNISKKNIRYECYNIAYEQSKYKFITIFRIE